MATHPQGEPYIYPAEQVSPIEHLVDGFDGHAESCRPRPETIGQGLLFHNLTTLRMELRCAECEGLLAYLADESYEWHHAVLVAWCRKVGVDPFHARRARDTGLYYDTETRP